MKRGPKFVIEVRYNPIGVTGGRMGCIETRLRAHKGIRGAGLTPEQAVRDLIRTAATFGFPPYKPPQGLVAQSQDYRSETVGPPPAGGWALGALCLHRWTVGPWLNVLP